MNTVDSSNLFIIKNTHDISHIENILTKNNYNFQLYNLQFNNNIDFQLRLFSEKLWSHYFLWKKIIINDNDNNNYWTILSDNITCIDMHKFKILYEWIEQNYNLFDIINLNCDINFLCNLKIDKICIDDKISLYKNLFNLSFDGYIISKNFINKIQNFDKDDLIKYPPNLLINFPSNNLINYNVFPYLIKTNTNSYINFKHLLNNYVNMFFDKLKSFLPNNDEFNNQIIILSIIVLIILLNAKTKNNIHVYFISIYLFIYFTQ